MNAGAQIIQPEDEGVGIHCIEDQLKLFRPDTGLVNDDAARRRVNRQAPINDALESSGQFLRPSAENHGSRVGYPLVRCSGIHDHADFYSGCGRRGVRSSEFAPDERPGVETDFHRSGHNHVLLLGCLHDAVHNGSPVGFGAARSEFRSHDRDIAHLHGRLGGRDAGLRPDSAQRQIAQADAKAQANNGHEADSEKASTKLSVNISPC